MRDPDSACYLRSVVRDRDIEAAIAEIADRGRRTRRRPPRWQWFAAGIMGTVCLIGFAMAMLGEPAPVEPRLEQVPVTGSTAGALTGAMTGSGLGVGLAIGAGVGLVIGFAIGRHRRDHSSRSNP